MICFPTYFYIERYIELCLYLNVIILLKLNTEGTFFSLCLLCFFLAFLDFNPRPNWVCSLYFLKCQNNHNNHNFKLNEKKSKTISNE